ncbi:MAG: NnrU family protein [Parvularculaceae bacterium]|nr:NnrU family protein [Parvularculaceae bacterium]
MFYIGLLVFFGAHLWAALARGSRARVIDRLGAMPFKGVFSLVSLAGFALIIIGWRGADAGLLYAPPAFLRHVTYLLMLVALVCLVAAYLPGGRIAATLKHPMLVGVKFWALAHLLSNGEVRSVVLFGSFLAFAVIDRIAVKKRAEPTRAAGPLINDGVAIIVGAAVWAAIYFGLHPYIAGVSLRP